MNVDLFMFLFLLHPELPCTLLHLRRRRSSIEAPAKIQDELRVRDTIRKQTGNALRLTVREIDRRQTDIIIIPPSKLFRNLLTAVVPMQRTLDSVHSYRVLTNIREVVFKWRCCALCKSSMSLL